MRLRKKTHDLLPSTRDHARNYNRRPSPIYKRNFRHSAALSKSPEDVFSQLLRQRGVEEYNIIVADVSGNRPLELPA
jgi:hypothetical protein